MHSTGQFPSETYINGLRDNPDSTLAVLYDEFRQPLIRMIMDLGGSDTDGAVFFQMAVQDAARLARAGELPQRLDLPSILEVLSQAHYRDWLSEHQQPAPAALANGPARSFQPDPAALRESRYKMLAWQRLQLLEPDCREALLAPPPETPALEQPESDAQLQECSELYLKTFDQAADDAPAMLPDWAQAALRDSSGYAIWQRTQTLELQWAARRQAPAESSRMWPWAIAALLIAIVGYGAYQFFFRPKTAAEVFADNFAPPASLMEDLDARYGAEMGNDSVTAQPNECIRLMREADSYYRDKDYQGALDPLLLIVLDSTSVCQSDAWFFLGIIQLQLEDPTTAIQCFAKIEDLGKYGEDLYWYQALAFVQLAKENPLMRDKARQAVERALGNTREPKRRAQAEKMLKNLSE